MPAPPVPCLLSRVPGWEKKPPCAGKEPKAWGLPAAPGHEAPPGLQYNHGAFQRNLLLP